MRIIGLTGGIGSGKSTVAHLFAAQGVPIIDTDDIAHALSIPPSPVLDQIAQVFGPEYLSDNGSLDRARMRQHIYAEPAAKKKLEAIFHPRIKDVAIQMLNDLPDHTPYAILAVPLLFETGSYSHIIDLSLLVDCSIEQQIARVQARNGLSKHEIEAIIASQCPRTTRIELADDIILNETTLAHLQSTVSTLHQRYQD
ncbi:dephospho-CoA kinase [Iodobacter sp.]|uniref:dephospho-CoA kinase n=1 Tax=Iodobacter sp. TaxID=1915058 RepID=UPI0025F44627|nr:dephospho-CoA kinase [Iodobacter sp.]